MGRMQVNVPAGGGGIRGVQQTRFSESQASHDLGASKDNTQVGSAISLSLVLVGYLKSILIAGPNGMQIYTVMLSLVIVTLILQLVAGLLSLYITLNRNFFAQFQGNLWRYCGKVCCSCFYTNKEPPSTESLCKLEYINEMTPFVSIATIKTETVVTGIDEDNIQCCYGVCCNNSGSYEPSEYEIFLQYNRWQADETRVLLEIKKAELDMKHAESFISELKAELNQTVESSLQQRLQEEIQKENGKIKTLKKRNVEFDKYMELGKILQANVENLRSKQTHKEASCLQKMLCMLVYFIVALNTVICALDIIPNHVHYSHVSNHTSRG